MAMAVRPADLAMPAPEAGAVVTKAVLRAAEVLGVSNRQLARVIGVSEATVSRMGKGAYRLAPDDKPFELALLFVRLYRSLDAVVGGDRASARGWMTADNTALGAAPVARVQTVQGLVDVIAYLDARRAVV